MRQILHMTHIDNLGSFAEVEAILSRADVLRGQLEVRSISYAQLNRRRAEAPVDKGPRGYVDEYVPWYFRPLQPMLWAIAAGRVPDVSSQDVAYCVTHVERVASDSNFVFTDGQFSRPETKMFDRSSELDRLDWDSILDPGPAPWRTDDRYRRRQAEFWVHRRVPVSLITEIAVVSDDQKRRALRSLEGQKSRWFPAVSIRRNWYP